VTAGPLLVTVIAVWNPVGHELSIEYATWHIGVAAWAGGERASPCPR
jgi:hypothetical protein